jgi:predicted ArsR family transcriptional regulator
MSRSIKRGRGRPKREYRIRVRAERREKPDYEKLARALLEHAAMQDRTRRETEPNAPPPDDNESDGGTS